MGRQFTRMGMGCWAVGGHGWGKVNDEDSIEAVRHAYERGVTFSTQPIAMDLENLKECFGRHWG